MTTYKDADFDRKTADLIFREEMKNQRSLPRYSQDANTDENPTAEIGSWTRNTNAG